MRYAIISDIHCNLEALEAVVDDFERLTIDRVICLGDVVGYCADPGPCLRFVRDLLVRHGNAPFILGNHDHGVGFGQVGHFGDIARAAGEWTIERLTEEERQYLRSSVFMYKENGAFFVHASPYYPQAWHYIIQVDQAEPQFNFFEGKICFIGHTHRPFIFERGRDRFGVRETLFLHEAERYLINVGSVGQPRNGDPRATYGLFDTESGLLDIRRVAYDISSAAGKIRAAKLPEKLAARLHVGA